MGKSISSVIAMITPGILNLLMENRKLKLEEAAELLYSTELYRTLEDEETKLWRLSVPALFDLYMEEKSKGRIIFPEET